MKSLLLPLLLVGVFTLGDVTPVQASGVSISLAVGDRPYYHGRSYRRNHNRYAWVPGHYVHRRHHRRFWVHGHYIRR